MWLISSLLVFSFGITPIINVPQPSPHCGYESCPRPKDGYVNLHLVPHSHDDVGWLKTVDQYYYGSRSKTQSAGVQYILDTVIKELSDDPKKRFIYVETAFFWKWWQEQDDTVRHQVKKLVNRGQLEFIGGGWSMNDEAATHYQSIIDQMTWGFRRLDDNFGQCGRPRVGWQIDPFGHSRENAAIMARLGFDGLFLGRIDWQDKSLRIKRKTMEMIWHTSQNDASEASKLFTGVMYNTYFYPDGFNFDIGSDDEPIIDNPKSILYNVNRRVDDFLHKMVEYSKAYRTANVIVTMGNDFNYQDAHVNFKNMDKLIKHINAIQGREELPFNAFYSTPSCYLKAVHDSQVALPTKSDDFFPYSSDPHAFWTGYFTSRPTIKRFERIGNNYLQVCKQLFTLAGISRTERRDLIGMREAMGVMQHHDAVTGTEQQHVADDYTRILHDAIQDCDDSNGLALRKIMGADRTVKIEHCLLLNESSCHVTGNNDNFVVTIYNPLSREVRPLMRFPVSSSTAEYSVKCPMGYEHPSQVNPLPAEVLQIPGRVGGAVGELAFLSARVPPLGYKQFYISKKTNHFQRTGRARKFVPFEPLSLGYDGYYINLDGNGFLQSVTINGKTEPFSIALGYYKGAVGDNKVVGNRSSGAYIFRPNGTLNVINSSPEVTVVQGDVVSEVRYKFSDWASSIVRVYKGVQPFHIEHEWLVGPIPIETDNSRYGKKYGYGKEVVVRYHVQDLHNNGEFLTDSNGREMILRKLNYRPTWDLNLQELIAGNYYPVTTRIAIQQDSNVWSVVTDRAQGGSSLQDGTMELMVHRRLTHDDAFGVEEALNETAYGGIGLVARGTHYIVPGSHAKARTVVQDKVLGAWPFFTPTQKSFEEWQSAYLMMSLGLKRNLDSRVQILTLEPWKGNNSYILRLEHILEINDDPNGHNEAVTVDLNGLFAEWNVVDAQEMVLGANLLKSDLKRLRWAELSANDQFDYHVTGASTNQPIGSITLKPMEIRTFIIKLQHV